jgi:hypothetical protein
MLNDKYKEQAFYKRDVFRMKLTKNRLNLRAEKITKSKDGKGNKV